MPKFRKKPVVIEAIQWTGDNELQIMGFVGKKLSVYKPPSAMGHDKNVPDSAYSIHIPTLEGTMTAQRNDWVIMGVNGEFYPCKPDIFEKSYEPAEVMQPIEWEQKHADLWFILKYVKAVLERGFPTKDIIDLIGKRLNEHSFTATPPEAHPIADLAAKQYDLPEGMEDVLNKTQKRLYGQHPDSLADSKEVPVDVAHWIRAAEDGYSHQKSDQDAYRAGAIDMYWSRITRTENPTRLSFVQFAYGCMNDRDKLKIDIAAKDIQIQELLASNKQRGDSKEVPKMSNELAALSDVAAMEYNKRMPLDNLDISAELVEAHEAGQTWMYQKMQEEIRKNELILSAVEEGAEQLKSEITAKDIQISNLQKEILDYRKALEKIRYESEFVFWNGCSSRNYPTHPYQISIDILGKYPTATTDK